MSQGRGRAGQPQGITTKGHGVAMGMTKMTRQQKQGKGHHMGNRLVGRDGYDLVSHAPASSPLHKILSLLSLRSEEAQ